MFTLDVTVFWGVNKTAHVTVSFTLQHSFGLV